jgi:hypothetical protein
LLQYLCMDIQTNMFSKMDGAIINMFAAEMQIACAHIPNNSSISVIDFNM